jgi:hypothetical protein
MGVDFDQVLKSRVETALRLIKLPLDDDKLYFVSYDAPEVFDLDRADFDLGDLIDFLGFGRGDYGQEGFDSSGVPFDGALNDLSLFCQFVSSRYDQNRGFMSVIQAFSEIDHTSARFISICFVKREKGLLAKDFVKREV